jgi:hypothetical protein
MPKKRKAMQYKRLSVFIGLLVLTGMLISLIGFTKGTPPKVDSAFIGDVVVHHAFSPQTRLGPQWVIPKGIGVGFVSPAERDTPPDLRSQTEEFHLEGTKDFETLLILQAPKSTVVLVTVLLDYKQVSFELDAQLGLLHQVEIKPGGDLEIPIKIRIDTLGIHDLIVIAFADPYNNSLDPSFRSSLDVDLVGRRTQLFVGEDTNIVSQLPEPIRGTKVPQSATLSLGVAFATFQSNEASHPSDLNRQLYVAKGEAGNLFKFQVWASNLNGEKGSDYALVMFKNYHQVPIQTQPLTIINLQSNEEAVINTEVTLSKTPGIDQIQIVYIFDPYKSILREEVRASHVFSSPRLVVEVTSK